jgi:anaerobic magnesium-protoporphyrin IX monomethyl ester cyclase
VWLSEIRFIAQIHRRKKRSKGIKGSFLLTMSLQFSYKIATMNVLLIEMNPFVPVSTPISLGYIAAFLESEGFRTKILTIGQDTPFSKTSLQDLIATFQPALVGFTAYQRTMLYVLGLAALVKSVDKNIKVAIGGPQATFMPSEALFEMPPVDYICRSSGEETLLGVARAIQKGTPFSSLAGVSYRDNDKAVHDTDAIKDTRDLDAYPSPYLNALIDCSRVSEAIVLTSRGCPHNCIFCYTPQAFDHKIKFHSIDRVIEEIRWIKKQGIQRLWIADPNISYKWTRVEALLSRLLTQGLETQMWLQTRADLVNPDMLNLMKRAGVSTIAFGLESGSEKVMSKLDKQVSIEKVAEAIAMAQYAGIEVELFTQFGLPHETFEDALKTLEFVNKNNVKIMGNTNSQQMQIYFGTPMERHYKDYNIRPLNMKRPAYISLGSQYETDCMNQQEMRKIQAQWRAASLDRGRRIVS